MLDNYHVRSFSVDGGMGYGVHWKGKMDPEFTFESYAEAQAFCDQLNADGPVHISDKQWNWIDASNQLPDDDIEVLVLTRSERLLPAVHRGGHWYPAYGSTGQRLASAAITHWIDPIYPCPSASIRGSSPQAPSENHSVQNHSAESQAPSAISVNPRSSVVQTQAPLASCPSCLRGESK